MKVKRIVVAILIFGLIVVGFNLSGLAFGPRYNPNFQTPTINNQYQANPLNLTDEQREELNQIQKDFFDSRDQLREELRDKQIELRDLYYAGDEGKSKILIDELNSLQKKLLELRTDMWSKFKEVLSAEQLEDLQKFQEQAGSYRAGFQPGFGPGARSSYGMGRAGFGMRGPGYGPRGVNPGFNPSAGYGYGCPWF